MEGPYIDTWGVARNLDAQSSMLNDSAQSDIVKPGAVDPSFSNPKSQI